MGLAVRARKLALVRDRAAGRGARRGLAWMTEGVYRDGILPEGATAAAGVIADAFVIERRWPESWDLIRVEFAGASTLTATSGGWWVRMAWSCSAACAWGSSAVW